MWIEDDYEPEWLEQGSSYEISSEDCAPKVRNPIGFMRHKPIVRINAFTQPATKLRIRIKAWSRPIF